MQECHCVFIFLMIDGAQIKAAFNTLNVDEQELLERIFQNDRANELMARLLGDTEQNNKAA
jgi:hypothetical protein